MLLIDLLQITRDSDSGKQTLMNSSPPIALRNLIIAAAIASIFVASASAGYIEHLTPAQNSITALPDTDIRIRFTEQMMPQSINDTTIVVHSRFRGGVGCLTSYNASLRTAILNPDIDFHVGDVVTVTITTGVRNSQGGPVDSAFVYSFTVRTLGGNGTFIPDSNYVTGGGPSAVLCADLDNDNDLDVVAGMSNNPTFRILEGKADGELIVSDSFTLPGIPVSDLISADLNSDGLIDLAFAHSISSGFSIAMNVGDAVFVDTVFYSSGDFPLSLTGSDFDGDGDIDIAIANTQSHNVHIFLNDGSGAFAPHAIHPVGQEPWGICAGDFDSDGDIDVATANDVSEDISVLYNDGAAGFDSTSVFPVGCKPVAISTADLDSDHDLDLVIANDNTDNVVVLTNSGDGTFTIYGSYSVQETPINVSTADLDGDFDFEIAAANSNSNTLSLRFNSGGDFSTHQVAYVGQAPKSIAFGDLDLDGDIDIASGNKISDDVTVLLNNLVCFDSDGDGFGDPLHPENQCAEDNCPYVFNPYQEDSDGDGVGDSCDICIDHPLDDCCDPRWSNSSPVITSSAYDTANPGGVFEYILEYYDPDCDGTELSVTFLEYPDWCTLYGDTVRGAADCGMPDDMIRVTVSDGSLSTIRGINVVLNDWNQPPAFLDTTSEFAVRQEAYFKYEIQYGDIDDSMLAVETVQLPVWLNFDADSVYGTAPSETMADTLRISVADYCHADTLNLILRVYLCGDVNSSGGVDIDDIIFLMNFIFSGGPTPVPAESGNANCLGYADIDDIVYLVDYVFKQGPLPCESCP